MSAGNNQSSSNFDQSIRDIIDRDMQKMNQMQIGSPQREVQQAAPPVVSPSMPPLESGNESSQSADELEQQIVEEMEQGGDEEVHQALRNLKRAADNEDRDREVRQRHPKHSRLESDPSTSQDAAGAVNDGLSASYVLYRCLLIVLAVFVIPHLISLFRQTN